MKFAHPLTGGAQRLRTTDHGEPPVPVAGERAGQRPGARRTLTRTVFFSFSARKPVALTGPVTLIADDLTTPST